MKISLYSVRIDGQKHWYNTMQEAKRVHDEAVKSGQSVQRPFAEYMPLDRENLIKWLNLQTSG